MANMNEKLLLLGFGIFTIISFFSIINPYLSILLEYNTHQKDYEMIRKNIEKIDTSIKYSANQENLFTFSDTIYIYKDLNLTISEFEITYSYFLIKKNDITQFYGIKLYDNKINLRSETLYNLVICYILPSCLTIEFTPKK
jgi:hypothetical protein